MHKLPFLTSAFLSVFIFLMGCGQDPSTDKKSHENEVSEWHKQRIESLKQPQGWLSLAGLHWLENGTNTFGSDRSNDVIFPSGTIDAHAGSFERSGDTVAIQVKDGVELFDKDGELITSQTIFTPDEATWLYHETLSWVIIKRDNLIGVRIYDENSTYLTSFNGIETFPVDASWRIEAEFIPHDEPKTIPITNVLGQTNQEASPGKLVFTKDGEEYSLIALHGSNSMFFVFGDETNREQTYGGGRFVYTDEPDDDGMVTLDFNKAYNPPCALTPYSTCPLPPKENRLDLFIDAGEKRYKLPEFD